ncbi:MAG: hypothetical protein ABI726_05685 [bacterium]
MAPRSRWQTGALGAIAALGLLPAQAEAGAALTQVEAGGQNRFDPEVAQYAVVSNQFYWQWGGAGSTARKHDVVQDKGLFRSPGGPRKSFPDPGFVLSASAGTFPYHCSVHGSSGGQGMSGKIKSIPGFFRSGEVIVGTWAGPTSTTGNRYDIRYRIGSGQWHTWKSKTAQLDGYFGQGANPVEIKPEKTYRFQARSLKRADPGKRSGWSPIATVDPL